MTLSIECRDAECVYAEGRDNLNVLLNVIMLSVIMLNVVILNDMAPLQFQIPFGQIKPIGSTNEAEIGKEK